MLFLPYASGNSSNCFMFISLESIIMVAYHYFRNHLLKNEKVTSILGFKINKSYYLSGATISRFEFLGKLIEIWSLPYNEKINFSYIKRKDIRLPINIEISIKKINSKNISLIRKIPHLISLSCFKLKSFIISPFAQSSAIFEQYGNHDVEGKIYRTNKHVIFIRNNYLIKLAMDLAILEQRNHTKNTPISKNTFNFNLIKDLDDDDINKINKV